MNKFTLLLLALIPLLLTSCFEEVPANHEGVLYNEWDGLSNEILRPGTHNCGWYDVALSHPLYKQKKEFAVSVQSSEGLEIGVKLAINWFNKKGTVIKSFEKYNLDVLNTYIEPKVAAAIKETIGTYKPEEIYSTKRGEVESKIESLCREAFDEEATIGLDFVEILDIDLPSSIVARIEKKIEEQQRTLTTTQEVETRRAEAEKDIITAEANLKVAELEAKKNRALTTSITPNVLEMKKLENQAAWIEKWDGVKSKIVGQHQLMLEVENY